MFPFRKGGIFISDSVEDLLAAAGSGEGGRKERRDGRGRDVLAGVDPLFDLGLGGGLVAVRSHPEGKSHDAALGHAPRARGYPVDPSFTGEHDSCVGFSSSYIWLKKFGFSSLLLCTGEEDVILLRFRQVLLFNL